MFLWIAFENTKNLWFSDVFKGNQKELWEETGQGKLKWF